MSVNQETIEKHKLYEEKAKEAVRLHDEERKSFEAISKMFGFDRNCFVKYLKDKKHIPEGRKCPPSIDKNILEEIFEIYTSQQNSITELAKKYGFNRNTLSRNLKKLYGEGCIRQDGRKDFDETYFDIIDTSEKAYWLGFLFADGYNSGAELEFCLQEKDKESVISFKKAIKSMHSIREKRVSLNGKSFLNFRISIKSKHLCESLARYGCIPRKTRTKQFPRGLDESLIRHFVRGFFDGDGAFIVVKRRYSTGYPEFTTGSEIFANELCQVLNGYNIACRVAKYNNEEAWSIRLSGKKSELEKFYHFMYDESTEEIRLSRKYEKFTSFLLNCRSKTKAV